MGNLDSKKYHVSDDGKVFRINDDGSFTELGNAEDLGRLHNPQPQLTSPNPLPASSQGKPSANTSTSQKNRKSKSANNGIVKGCLLVIFWIIIVGVAFYYAIEHTRASHQSTTNDTSDSTLYFIESYPYDSETYSENTSENWDNVMVDSVGY